MRKAQKKALMKKLAKVAHKKIEYLHEFDNWSYAEVARKCDIIPARITEIVRGYDVDVAEITIIKLIGGGIITVSELIKSGGLTEEEIEYTGTMLIYEDTDVKAALLELKQLGVDAMEGLRPLLEKARYQKTE